jgi:hypothetical protein
MAITDPAGTRGYSGDVPSREELIEKAEGRLLRHGWPRLQMFILVALTGAAGFLASYTLLQLGMESMTLRYPIAVAVAYCVFLLLLRVWLAVQSSGWEGVMDAGDLVEVADIGLDGTGHTAQTLSHGGRSALRHVSGSQSGSGKGFDFSLDFDESAVFVLVAILIIAVAALATSLWLVWMAPGLFAEVLVDGLIMAGLYRRLKRHDEPEYWLYGAVRRTWVSAVIAALLFSIAGGLIHQAVPEARSLGAAWKAVQAEEGTVR